MTRGKTSLTAAAAIGALIAAGATAAPASAAPAKKQIARTESTWVAHTKSQGRASGKAASHFRVYLAPQGGLAAEKAAVASVSDPSSASYRHFLSAKQFHARYDATPAEAASVTSWLKSNDLKVTGTEAHRRYVDVTGSNAAVEKAFSTTIKTFRHNGHTVQANTSPVAVPASIAPLIITVSGLDTTPSKITHNTSPKAPSAGYRNARPCSKTYGQVPASTKADFKTPLPKFQGKTVPYAVCGYTGPLYRAAYEHNSTLDGTGATVAITDAYASPTIAKDANTYAKNNGDGAYSTGQLAQSPADQYTNKKACDPQGWYGEETLDVEAVHAMAPGAHILYYASASCNDSDFLTTLARVVDDNQASLVSNSWGDVEANETTDSIAAYEQVFMQGALQGIAFTFSSGDNGDEVQNTGIKQADYPTSDPYVTSVGGTADAITSAGTFAFQTGWGTQKYTLTSDGTSWSPVGYLYGAGGGNSSLFNKPDYQQGVVPASNGSGRGVPDVALDADPTTGMLVGQTQAFPDGNYYSEYRIGGTSLASPLFAGMTALRTQAAGGRLGLLNPSIYKNAGTQFNDVKGTPKDAANVRVDYANGLDSTGGLLYSIRTFNQDSSLTVKKGWDDVTGVGSPNPAWLSGK